jgi:RNA polymerase sigma-70 factor (ECF subfamily)
MPDSTETRRLLQRATAGEPDAAGRLLERHRPYLRRLVDIRLDARLRARVDPSDVVQEAQIEAPVPWSGGELTGQDPFKF